ncbi:MAG: PspA/IM30 family protein [Lachnospiraceae bacterium]|nr:PspA/IM30 family protein [Lachnospiraceae bacterium]
MSILSRFASIMKSNINALMDAAEDPGKMADQTLRELRQDLAEVKKETASVMANEKRAKRLVDECNEDIQKYALASEKALVAGNVEDAKALIKKKQQYQGKLQSLEENYAMAKSNADKMQEMHDKLVDDIDALEIRKEAIKAKFATAKAQEHMNKVIAGGKNSESSVSAFERFEAKADNLMDKANAEGELNARANRGSDLLDKYMGGGSEQEVDAELAELAAKLGLNNPAEGV